MQGPSLFAAVGRFAVAHMVSILFQQCLSDMQKYLWFAKQCLTSEFVAAMACEGPSKQLLSLRIEIAIHYLSLSHHEVLQLIFVLIRHH